MHRPPSASVPIGRNPWHLGALVAFAAFSAIALAFQWHGLSMLTKASVVLTWAASVVIALWHWKQLPSGRLLWDGQHWAFVCASHALEVRPQLVMDLQFLLVLKLKPATQGSASFPHWVCIDSSQAKQLPGAWSALRRALVFAQPRSDSDKPLNPEAKAGAL